MPEFSIVIITRDEERNILRCIESVKPLATEIVVVDSGSTDNTVELCKANGCRIFYRKFDSYGKQKQFAIDQAINNWILSIDADEIVTDTLCDELQIFSVSSVASTTEGVKGFYIPFVLHFMGKVVRHSGAGRNLRLFDKSAGKFTLVPVHETFAVNGTVSVMKGHIIHYSYRNISHHLEKLNFYTSLAAEGYNRRGKKYFKCWTAFKFPITFFNHYFVRRGFLDGYQGFIWSFLAGVYTTLKVAKTIESYSEE